MIGDEVLERRPDLYRLVKAGVDEALFPLFREQCKYLSKKEVANGMVLHECKNPKNRWAKEMPPEKFGLPNCAFQGCPIYKP